MSRTLTVSFADALWSLARRRGSCGQGREALKAAEAALAAGGMSKLQTVLLHREAATWAARLERFALARRHLRAALSLRPEEAAIHHDLGLCFQDDPYGCDRRAARRFARAVKLAPNGAAYRAAFGVALVRLNKVGAGLKQLRLAAELAPADARILAAAVEGAREAGRPELAKKWVEVARFRAPGDADVLALWRRVRFDVAEAGQRRRVQHDGPATVPFLRMVVGTTRPTVAGGVVRCDAGSRPAPHFARLRAHQAE